MKGAFIIKRRIGKDMPVISEVKSARPVDPPSIKLLGSRNPFNPKPAEIIPHETRIMSFIILSAFNITGFIFLITGVNKILSFFDLRWIAENNKPIS